MRIGRLLPLNISFAPYLRIYTSILDQLPYVEYDIIYPDKKGLNEPAKYRFDLRIEDTEGKLKKMLYYWRYSHFIVRILKKEKYDKLIVFGQQVAIFIYRFLNREYKGRYIMDYRDLGLDQVFKWAFRSVLQSCEYIVLSSPGFMKYLPERNDYVLSHNFDVNILLKSLADRKTQPYILTKQDGKINVLTIGSIRDYEQNSSVIAALANNSNFHITFAGRGDAVANLETFAKDRNVKNIIFTGYYDKSSEPEIISKSTFLNIFYPLRPTHETAISNRFYNSLMFRKPMITTIGTIQGDYTEKYGLGIAIENTVNLAEQLTDYYNHFDSMKFEEQRSLLLNKFKKDYDRFEQTVKLFASC
jgi:hypothetical protein